MKVMKPLAARARLQHDEMERLFDRMFAPSLTWRDGPLRETEWALSLDFSETDKEFFVRLEAPAIHRESFEMSMTRIAIK